jgi:hypothetical protein
MKHFYLLTVLFLALQATPAVYGQESLLATPDAVSRHADNLVCNGDFESPSTDRLILRGQNASGWDITGSTLMVNHLRLFPFGWPPEN